MTNTITNFDFFTAGKAIFTVFNNKGERYTYKIDKKPDSRNPDHFVFFVRLLTGPDNNTSYTYLGLFKPNYLEIKLGGKSTYTYESKPVKVLIWALHVIHFNEAIPEGYGIIHEGKCCACGKRLTTPKSIALGIGPECEKRM